MSEATGLQKHYILDTKEVDIERAVYDRFDNRLRRARIVSHTRIAPTGNDIPAATDELFRIVQAADDTLMGKKFAWFNYKHTKDEDGQTTLTLDLIYVSL